MNNKTLYNVLTFSLLFSFLVGITLILNGDTKTKADYWFIPVIFIQFITSYNYGLSV